jgi:hypothetical protein
MESGDFHIDENVGKTTKVAGPQKAAQDMIEELMTDYDDVLNKGTKIRTLTNLNLIRQELAETFDRGKERQKTNSQLSPREAYDTLTRLIVRSYNGTDVVFLMEILTVSKDKTQVMLVLESSGDLIKVDHQYLP